MKGIADVLRDAQGSWTPPKPSSRAIASSDADLKERIRIFTRLFACYPPTHDLEARMSMYLEVTADIPSVWISFACHALVRKPDRFPPSIGELRVEAARAARRFYGEGAGSFNPSGDHEIDAERWLEIARERAQPAALPEGQKFRGHMLPAVKSKARWE